MPILLVYPGIALEESAFKDVFTQKEKRPKPKISATNKLMLKRKISTLKGNGEKVNSPKLIRECMSVSRYTMGRYLRQQGMTYRKIKKYLPLKPLDKIKRSDFAKKWLEKNPAWELTIFSDEKWFSLDGPDNWSSYVKKIDITSRPKHQKNGGVIMVWAMVLPNDLLSFKILKRDFKS